MKYYFCTSFFSAATAIHLQRSRNAATKCAWSASDHDDHDNDRGFSRSIIAPSLSHTHNILWAGNLIQETIFFILIKDRSNISSSQSSYICAVGGVSIDRKKTQIFVYAKCESSTMTAKSVRLFNVARIKLALLRYTLEAGGMCHWYRSCRRVTANQHIISVSRVDGDRLYAKCLPRTIWQVIATARFHIIE